MPVELVEIICECIVDEADKKSLSTLALTSSTFLHLVRSRRFYTIRNFPTLCSVEDAAGYSSFSKLLEESPSIGHYVREIYIAFQYHDRPERSWYCKHPNSADSHHSDELGRRTSYHKSMNALSFMLAGIPHVRVLKFGAGPDFMSWDAFLPSTQSALSSLLLQNSVISILFAGISNLPGSLLGSILQLQNLTSLTWSHISHDPADLVPLQALRVSSLNNIRDLCFSGKAIFGTEPPSELANLASLILKASVAKVEHFTCYNWYCHATLLPVEVGNLTNLKRLSLGFDYIPISYAVLPFIRNIVRGGHQSMEILELRIHDMLSTADVRAEAQGMAEFDLLLQERAFDNLQEVQFHFFCQFERIKLGFGSSYFIENVMSIITEFLPRSVSKGLKVVASAPPIPIYDWR
ncbi:hypothetical protein M413DRAFT_25615 [Hebeloma cylindrosporum]|uniref:F-box domain-containing protein n=1 Tax=Hebeloma cylindrosporum TaxID=76867 RepID=A0A0C2Y2W2_HEBCY|nr:hypothetical protein M413DRAFT_25615 [Hebeloma cylindrosporum h7]